MYGIMLDETSTEEEQMERRNSLQEQIKILDTDRSWNELLYKDTLSNERKDLSLN